MVWLRQIITWLSPWMVVDFWVLWVMRHTNFLRIYLKVHSNGIFPFAPATWLSLWMVVDFWVLWMMRHTNFLIIYLKVHNNGIFPSGPAIKCWKIWFCISYKTHSGSNKHGSNSFKRDNMSSWILEQRIESIPWCSEIQNEDLRLPLINIPIPHGAREEWSLN